jgi:TolB-like protein
MKKESSASHLRFGLFELNLQTGELHKQGLKIKLGRHAFGVLALLLELPGQLRTREEIRQQLWGTDTFVNFDQSVNKAIHQLREALGDPAGNPHYVQTVVGLGYRFIYFAQESSEATRKQIRNLRSVAVLPFATEPADREIELLSKSIVKLLIDTISQTPGLQVLAYSTVQHYREPDLNPQVIGQNLPVRIVALGEMTRSDDELGLHVELVDVRDGTQLWGAQFKESYSDVSAKSRKAG